MAEAQDDEFSDLNLDGDEPPAKQPVYHRHKTFPKTKKFIISLLVIIVVASLAFAGWKLVKRSKPTTHTTTSTTTQAPTNVVSDVPASSTTKNYNSETMALSLNYPSDWILTTLPDNSIRITSPNFTYKTVAGTSVDGNFRLYIRQTARPVDDKYIGRGFAVNPSQSLTYTKPTSTQRQSTYLTNFGLDSSNNFAYFFIAGNFNLNPGDSLGPNYGIEPGTDIIAGGYSATSLTDDMATNEVPLDYYATTNAYKQAVDIVKTLQLD